MACRHRNIMGNKIAIDITEVPYNWEEVTDQNGKVVAYKQVSISTVSTGD